MTQQVVFPGIARRLLFSAVTIVVALYAAAASAVVVTFDDLNLTSNQEIPDGYGGINWTTSPLIDFLFFGGTVDPNVPNPSPPAAAYARNGFDFGPVSLRFLKPEIFGGTFVHAIADTCGGTCPNPVPLTVKHDLSLGGVLKHETDLLIGNNDWQFLASGYSGLIDEVTFVKSNGQYAAFIDNVTYSDPVPEPSSCALLLAGLAGSSWLFRRRKVAVLRKNLGSGLAFCLLS